MISCVCAGARNSSSDEAPTGSSAQCYGSGQGQGYGSGPQSEVGDGFSPVVHARFEEGLRGVDSGVPGVERETHRRIASKSWLEREVDRKNRKNNQNQLGSAYFFKQVDGSIDFSLLKSHKKQNYRKPTS